MSLLCNGMKMSKRAGGATVLAAYKAARDADSPVASWDLEETSGTTAACNETSAYDLTHYNSPILNQTGPFTDAKAVTYGGTRFTDAFIVPVTAYPFTMECFIRRNSGVEALGLVVTNGSSFNSYALLNSNSTRGSEYQVRSGADAFQSTGFISVNDATPSTDWNHIALIATSSSSNRLVVNGIDFGISGLTSNFPSGLTRLTLGALFRSAPTIYSDVSVSLPAIYSTALTVDRIAAHYAASGL